MMMIIMILLLTMGKIMIIMIISAYAGLNSYKTKSMWERIKVSRFKNIVNSIGCFKTGLLSI